MDEQELIKRIREAEWRLQRALDCVKGNQEATRWIYTALDQLEMRRQVKQGIVNEPQEAGKA